MHKRFVAIALFSIGALMATTAATAQDQSDNPSRLVEVTSYRIVDSGVPNVWSIQGTAVNESQQTLPQAFVRFKAYDSTGAVIGNTMDMVQNLGPGETWHFKADVVGAVSRITLDDVSPH